MAARGKGEAEARRILDRLASLRIDPAARARAAIEGLAGEPRLDVLFACTQALEAHPLADAKPALLATFERLDRDAKRLDAGGDLRAAALRALHPWLTREDIPLAERAVAAYSRTLQGPGCVGLRAAGLMALLSIAPESVAAHAARVLAEAADTETCTRETTGEPAVTAARVLGASGDTVALYLAASASWRPQEDALAECLRQLVDLPGEHAAALVERFAEDGSEIVQLGLVDLIAGNALLAPMHPGVRAFLAECGLEVLHYALATFVASRRMDLHELVAALVADEFARPRLEVAAKALAMARGAPALEVARKAVEAKLADR